MENYRIRIRSTGTGTRDIRMLGQLDVFEQFDSKWKYYYNTC